MLPSVDDMPLNASKTLQEDLAKDFSEDIQQSLSPCSVSVVKSEIDTGAWGNKTGVKAVDAVGNAAQTIKEAAQDASGYFLSHSKFGWGDVPGANVSSEATAYVPTVIDVPTDRAITAPTAEARAEVKARIAEAIPETPLRGDALNDPLTQAAANTGVGQAGSISPCAPCTVSCQPCSR